MPTRSLTSLSPIARLATRLILGLTCAAFPAWLASAEESTIVSDRVQVDLVLVDVLVTGSKRQPILDLSVEDFELFVDGDPWPIAQFSPPATLGQGPASPTTRPDSQRTSPPAPQRKPDRPPTGLLVIYLDEQHLLPTSRHRILSQLTPILSTAIASGSQVMIASYDGTVQILQSPTNRLQDLEQVLQAKLLYGSQSLMLDHEASGILHLLRTVLETEINNLRRIVPPEQVMDLACSATQPIALNYAQQVFGRVEASSLALEEFLRSLQIFPGTKALLHVSDGLPLARGQKAVEYLISLCDGTYLISGIDAINSALACCPPARQFPSSTRMALQEVNTVKLWDRVAAAANFSRTTLHTLQASGLDVPDAGTTSGERLPEAVEFGHRANLQDPLFLIADETGGRATFNTNIFDAALDSWLSDSAKRYELAFVPSTAGTSRDTHRIRVEVKRPGAKVHHRKSYQEESKVDAGVAAITAALYHGQESNQHRMSISARPRTRQYNGTIRRRGASCPLGEPCTVA